MVILNVRLPDELHAKVKKLAEEERRSMNSEFIVLLEKAIRELEKEKEKDTG